MYKMKKIIIAGGTGYLGERLCESYLKKGYQVTVLTRRERKVDHGVHFIHWDGTSIGDWVKCLENADLLVNLTGKSVNCRYTTKNKAEILNSRILSTRVLNEAVLACKTPPKHWINSSTATIYKHAENKPMTEKEGAIGNDFSMNVAKKWEKEFFSVNTPKTLKTAIRTSIVIGEKSEALHMLNKLVKMRLGGNQGNGQQMVSWIHDKDFTRAIEFITDNRLEGSVNVCHAKPVRNTELMKVLRENVNVKQGLNAPKLLINIGAFLFGTEKELVLKSRFVLPERLLNAGFKFQYSSLDEAIKNTKI